MNVVRTVDGGGALRGQGRQDERGAGAQVADLDLGAVQARATVDRRVLGVDLRRLDAHLARLAEPLEPVLEDRFVDVGGALGLGQQHAGGRLEVRGEARIRPGLDVAGAEGAGAESRAVDLDGVAAARDADADAAQRVEEGARGGRTGRPRA